MYNINSQIKFKTSVLKSSLCDYSDVYTLVSRTTTLLEEEEMMQQSKLMKEIKK